MSFACVKPLSSFGTSIAGVRVAPKSTASLTAVRPTSVVVEAKSRRNPKKEKAQRNRRRANEIKRMSKSAGQTFFQRRNQDEGPKVSEDYVSPFHYDSRGEPLNSTDEA